MLPDPRPSGRDLPCPPERDRRSAPPRPASSYRQSGERLHAGPPLSEGAAPFQFCPRGADTARSSSPVLLAHETLPDLHDEAMPPASPVDSGLRLITERLAVSAAMLFASESNGALRLLSAVGTWGGDALAMRNLAETLAGDIDVLDVTGAIEGARFAAGARLGDGEGALLVIDSQGRTPDPNWNRAFVDSAQTALGLIRATTRGGATTQVLHEVAVHPGTFDQRLALALVRLADAVGLDGAVFARIEEGQWTPESIFDPSERLIPTRSIPVRETFCAFTAQSDGPFAVQSAPDCPLPIRDPAAYLGAPIFIGGKCAGTLSAASHRPRARPFGDEDLALIEALARWIGSAVGGLDTARRLAAREADLSAFFDAAPMGMGLVRLVDTPRGADLEIAAINRAGAAMVGGAPETLVGTQASRLGLARSAAVVWLRACRTALASGSAQRFEFGLDGRDGRRTLAATVAPVAHDDARFTFVIEDTTDSRRAADRIREREAQIEALVSQAPVALFATDRGGRLATSRGRSLDLLGLSIDHALGRPVQDIFATANGAREGIAAALDGGEGTWSFEGGDRSFRIQALARRDAQGRPCGLIGVALDTTHVAASRARDVSAQMRSALLKHLDHEIRSPLTSILGYAELLSEHTPPGEVVEVRDVISRSGERLMSALDDLLDLALLDDDQIEVHPTAVDPSAIVSEIAEAGRAAAEARQLALNVWCSFPEEHVLIDRRLFERVVRHLVTGAVASAPGTRVDVRLKTDGPEAMELSVLGGVPTDGLGIGPTRIHRLVRAMGGSAQEVPGDEGGWILRLPRHRVPVVDLSQADGWTDEAPELAGDGLHPNPSGLHAAERQAR